MDTSSQNDLLFSQFHPDIGTVPRPLLTGFYSIRLGLPIKVEDILDSRSASPTGSIDGRLNAVSYLSLKDILIIIVRWREFMQLSHLNYRMKPNVGWQWQMLLGLFERPSKDWPNVNHTRIYFFSNFMMPE